MQGILKQSVIGGYGAFGAICNLVAALIISLATVFVAPPGRAEAAVTVVMLGDSLTAGYGLPDGEGLVPELQRWLDANGGGVILQNAGVSGDTTAGGVARIDWALGPDAQALVVELGGNDMLRGLSPSEVRTNLIAILQAAQTRGLPVLLIGMQAPANWGPDYKAEFDAIYPEIAAEFDAILVENFFHGLIAAGGDPGDPASMARWMQADGIHPNAEGVKLIAAALGPEIAKLAARVQ
ncbi:MAG: arylesterase [Rhodobacteraceae bacterium]|nr:arylesterase [Paracoccaceae bacterium]